MPKTEVKKTTKKKIVKTIKKEKKDPKVVDVKKEEVKKEKAVKFFEGVGRRKTSIARVRLFTQVERSFLVNSKSLEGYFTTFELQETASSSLKKMNCFDRFSVSVVVKGGGINSQAEAVRHGAARALMLFNPEFRKRLKKAGYLKRDPRMRERKKPGLKRARKAPQWKKR